LEDECWALQRSPVKRIRWSKKDYLRGLGCCREVQWSGIDCDKKTRLLNQCRQSEQICFSREIDNRLAQSAFNFTEMFLFDP
jgi:hypothetical protein